MAAHFIETSGQGIGDSHHICPTFLRFLHGLHGPGHVAGHGNRNHRALLIHLADSICGELQCGHREAEAVRLIRRAFDLGYTFFDTAEVYGTADAPHVNETLVGKALADVKNHTVIATKFGLRFDQESGKVPLPLVADSRPETIRKSVEGSLKRLGTDHIDLYFQHRIDPNVEPETVAEVMADLIQEGKITHWGISEANEDYLRRAHAVCPVTAVQNRYSMMARHYEPLFPILEESEEKSP